MILTWEQTQAIIKNNPNKGVVDAGKTMADKLMMHLQGIGVQAAIKNCDYFASPELYKIQKEYAISNKDLFNRLLQQEDMVFSARGGSSYFHLPDSDEAQMNDLLSNVRYGMSLRKWIRNIAIQAYRADPAGIIFMEVEPLTVQSDGSMNDPRTYPTYKSIYSIYDYQTTGRNLEYACFQLTVQDCLSYGVIDDTLKNMAATAKTDYFRVVDDKKDLIAKKEQGTVILVSNITQPNPILNNWTKVPGFVVSDLFKFYNPQQFVSPVDFVVELADCYLNDRSVRDLQKKYHGFAKAIEPLLKCPTCNGTGFNGADTCPSCTIPGQSQGSGYKLRTKVSDVVKFPLEILESGSFDYRKIFGYVSPDILGWEKQDRSLEDLEELMEMTYWGTVRMRRPQPGQNGSSNGEAITATESSSNEAPKESRLNATADWAEITENMIAEFIGQYWFTNWRGSSISYGRDYILRTAAEYKDVYVELRTKGAPDSALDDAFRKWKVAEFQNNPIKQVIELKKFDVEPFPHLTVSGAKALVSDFIDFNCKLYFGEWSTTLKEAVWITTDATTLREQLKTYVEAKEIPLPVPETVSATLRESN